MKRTAIFSLVMCALSNGANASETLQEKQATDDAESALEKVEVPKPTPCEKGKTKGEKYSKLYAPAELKWGMCPEQVKSALSEKMKFESQNIIEKEGNSFIQRYTGEFAEFPANMELIFCAQTSLCAVTVSITKDDYASRNWEVAAEKLKKKFGAPKKSSKIPNPPGHATISKLKKDYPNTKNKAAIIENMSTLWGIESDTKYRLADDAIKKSGEPLFASWEVKGIKIIAIGRISKDEKSTILLFLSPEGFDHLDAINADEKNKKVGL